MWSWAQNRRMGVCVCDGKRHFSRRRTTRTTRVAVPTADEAVVASPGFISGEFFPARSRTPMEGEYLERGSAGGAPTHWVRRRGVVRLLNHLKPTAAENFAVPLKTPLRYFYPKDNTIILL